MKKTRKVKHTTYLSALHIEDLERLVREKGIPMITLLSEALDNYFRNLWRSDSPEKLLP